MKVYPKYKPSGIDWLGEIPDNWRLEKIKFLGKVIAGSTPETKNPIFWEGDIVWVTPIDFGAKSQKYVYKSARKITNEGLVSIGNKILPKGSVIVSSRAPIGLVALAGVDFVTNQGCKSIIPTKINNEYLFFFIKTFSIVLENLGNETVFAELSMSSLKNFFISIPPIAEQQKIVDFLDYKTGQCDRFIANRQKQIELLNEQKAVIINKAVTKGINPNAKMKPSGIEWIGDIPESWIICKARRVLDTLTDFSANGSFADLASNVKYLDKPDYSRLIRLTDLREGLKNDGIYVSKEAHEYLSKSALFGGEILMANVGAYAGLVCLVPKIHFVATLGPNMFLLKFNQQITINQYAFTLLGSNLY